MRIREALHALRDSGGTPSAAVALHLARCSACVEFQRFLSQLPAGLREVVDEPLAAVPSPSYDSLFVPRPRPAILRRFAVPAAAAVLAIAIGAPSAILTIRAVRERAAMRSAVGMFVSDLFSAPAVPSKAPLTSKDASRDEILDALLRELGSD